MASESLNRDRVEAALASVGLTVLQETGGLVIYSSNHFPGPELMLDWEGGFLTRQDLGHALEVEGINPGPILSRL